mmetsp:Transcript_8790/g.22132  ORF Transcript_8790/g.22132 Transcript_8790/m.22132 type:complete len:264 (-) Transcript_8790:2466-3257(-)
MPPKSCSEDAENSRYLSQRLPGMNAAVLSPLALRFVRSCRTTTPGRARTRPPCGSCFRCCDPGTEPASSDLHPTLVHQLLCDLWRIQDLQLQHSLMQKHRLLRQELQKPTIVAPLSTAGTATAPSSPRFARLGCQPVVAGSGGILPRLRLPARESSGHAAPVAPPEKRLARANWEIRKIAPLPSVPATSSLSGSSWTSPPPAGCAGPRFRCLLPPPPRSLRLEQCSEKSPVAAGHESWHPGKRPQHCGLQDPGFSPLWHPQQR